MAILGTESFNGPVNAADLQVSGYWASPYTLTGAGVSTYGTPGQYRSLMRSQFTRTANSAYPFATATGNNYFNVIPMGNVQDLYNAGGFWLGWTADCLSAPTYFMSNGTDILGLANPQLASGQTTTDYIHWNNVTNTVLINSGTANSLSSQDVRFINGKFYCISGAGWALGDATMPGTWVTTAFNLSGNNGYYCIIPGGVADTNWYVGGYVYAGGFQPRIWTSPSGAINTWTEYSIGGEGVAQKIYRFNDMAYAIVNPNADFSYFSSLYRRTGGTWTSVININTRNGFQVMDTNGTTIVVAGASGRIYSSIDDGVTWVARTSGTLGTIVDLKWTGTEFVAFVSTLEILYSTDGQTWTLKPRDLISVDPIITTGALHVTTKGIFFVNNVYVFQWDTVNKRWSCLRAAFPAAFLTNGTAIQPTGFFLGNGTDPAGTITNSRCMCGFVQYFNRLDTVGTASTTAWATVQSINTNDAVTTAINSPKRYEMQAVAVPGQSVPTFDVQWFYDGTPQSSILRITALNGTQTVYFTTAAAGHSQWYDLIWGDRSGTRNNTVMGNVRLLKRALTTDTQAQWDRVPPELATNAAAAQGNGSCTLATSSIQTTATGQTDQYSAIAPSVPAGYKISALTIKAAAQRTGLATPTVRLGVIDGGAAMPVASTILSGTTTQIVPLKKIYERDNAGQVWTPASVRDSLASIQNPVFGPDEDPLWPAVSLLAKFNGANGATVLVDSAGKTQLTSVAGAAQRNTQANYYPTSLDLNIFSGPTNQQVNYGLTNDHLFGAGDFTVEFWVYKVGAADQFLYYPGTFGSGNFFFLITVSGAVRVVTLTGTSTATLMTTTSTIPANTWTHVALTRASGTARLFIVGVQGATAPLATNYTVLPGSTGYIGGDGSTGNSLTGYLSEFRITKGFARYTANFTPPTAAMPDH